MLGFLGKALKTVAGLVGLDDIGKKAVETIEGLIGSNPELQKALAEQELEFRKLAIQEGDSIRELYAVEVKSGNKFIQYARPGMLWLVAGIIAVNFILIPLLNTVVGYFGAAQIVVVFPTLPEEIYWLFGSVFGLYTGARTIDKKIKNGKK